MVWDPCPVCKTKRWITMWFVEECRYCTGIGCPECHGKGKVRTWKEGWCPKCDGEGYIETENSNETRKHEKRKQEKHERHERERHEREKHNKH